PRPPRPTLFPYTTLFRSAGNAPPPPELLGGKSHSNPPVYLFDAPVEEPDVAVSVSEGVGRGDEFTLGPRPKLRPDRVSHPVKSVDRKSTRLNSSHLVISY